MSLETICDVIILIGAFTVALTNIYNFFKRPHLFFKNKKEENEKKEKEKFTEEVTEIIKEKMPDILLTHDLETREKYLSDRQQYLCDIKEEVLKDTQEILDGILQINLEQNEYIKVLTKTSKDVLRQRIMDIYHKYKHEKRMPIHAREALDELYKDYKAENGNSYIDKYYNRMKLWETYDDEEY